MTEMTKKILTRISIGLLIVAFVILPIIYLLLRQHILQGQYEKMESVVATSFKQKKDYVPFIIYPNKKDSVGNVILTSEQMENVRKHIEYLSDKVDKSVTDIKSEVANDISRLNLWVTIWIGVLAIFGAFFPMYVGWSSAKQAEKAFDGKLKEARKEAGIAIRKARAADTKVQELSGSVKKLGEDYTATNTKAEEAHKKADRAEKLINTIRALSYLRMLDINRMAFAPNKLFYFTNQLEKVKNGLDEYVKSDDINDIELIKESLSDLVMALNSFGKYFDGRTETKSIYELITFLGEKLKGTINKEALEAIVAKLNETIEKLKAKK